MLMDNHDLILNNKPGKVTKLTWRKTTLIIDPKFITPKTGALDTLVINKQPSTQSDYEVIVCGFSLRKKRLAV